MSNRGVLSKASFDYLVIFTCLLIAVDIATMYANVYLGNSTYSIVPVKYYRLLFFVYAFPISLLFVRYYFLNQIPYLISLKKIDIIGVTYCFIMLIISISLFFSNNSHIWFNQIIERSLLFIYMVSVIFLIVIIMIFLSDYFEYRMTPRYLRRIKYRRR